MVGGSRLAAAVQAEEHWYVQLDQGTSPVFSWNDVDFPWLVIGGLEVIIGLSGASEWLPCPN